MWPSSHFIMFFGMYIIHLFIMPWITIANTTDFMVSLNQIYMGSAMSALMAMLEGTMHPMPYFGWILFITIFIIAVCAIRYQWFINDEQYLRDMIQHHSMALFTSRAAKHKSANPIVKQLAINIAQTQEKEIDVMKDLL